MYITALLKSGGSDATGGKKISCSREGKIKQVCSAFPLGATQGACTRVGGLGGIHQLELSAGTFIKRQLLLHHL